MSWKLSRYRAGDLVEVRSMEEILATLDSRGRLESMPFMPEMLEYCGKRFRVGAVAHKTCDTAHRTWKGRRLQAAVHLEGLRCNGEAHAGCEAQCNIFWKDDWLKPAEDRGSGSTSIAGTRGCSEAQLRASVHPPAETGSGEPRYSCQATELYEATEPLAWWDLRQYVFDVVTRNRSARGVMRVLFLASLRRLLPRLPFGYRVFKTFHDSMHLRLSGRPSPTLSGQIREGARSPTGRIDLRPGEYVRIKTQAEIETTINKAGRNRGLSFDPEEMAPYCGRVVRVQGRVTKIIEEHTGKLLQMKEPCIILDGVVCKAEYASDRLNCPRALPSFWREIWLERVREKRDLEEPAAG
jgi:hypothetical protein